MPSHVVALESTTLTTRLLGAGPPEFLGFLLPGAFLLVLSSLPSGSVSDSLSQPLMSAVAAMAPAVVWRNCRLDAGEASFEILSGFDLGVERMDGLPFYIRLRLTR